MASRPPQLWVFAGPNGADKSTLVAKYLRGRLPIVNPDVIAAKLNSDRLGSPAVIEAGKIAVRERAAFLAMYQSFAIETTLSGNSEIRLMREASRARYKVNLVCVGVKSPQVSERRVAHRVRKGEHFVPTEDIVRRYPRSMENLAPAMLLAHRSIIIDNTGEGFRMLMIRESGSTRITARGLPGWALNAIPHALR